METQVNTTAGTPFGGRPVRVAVGSDERLAQLAAGGSEWAFVALYERYHGQLYRYCRSIVRNDADAQDALQSTLTGAFAALRRGKRDAPVRPWLFRIAHNESVSVLRRRRPEEQLSELFPDSIGSTEERVEQRERLALLMADLHELPERQRGALVMRELNDLSHEQIAIALRTSVGAAKQTIFEARGALLEFAEGRTMACDSLQRTISDADGRALRGRRVRAHLRDCPACAAFATGISTRREALRAVAPPIAASSLLARVLAGAAGEAATATGAGGVVAGAAGKTAGAVLASKALAGVVLVTAATVGTTTAATRFTHPSTRTARGTPVGTVGGTPLTSGAHLASRMRRAAGDAAASPPAGSATASPHAGPAGHTSAAGGRATSGADAVRAGRGAGGSTAGNGGAAQSPSSHPGRSSTAPGRAVSQGGGPPAAAPGRAAAKGGGRAVAPGRAASQGGGPPAAPSGAVPKGRGPAATPGRAASQGASHPPAPGAASSGAPQAQSAARPAPPGHAASQGSSRPPGPPPDPGGGASQTPHPERGASHSAAKPVASSAAAATPHGRSPA
jgi:RNA polymerase sigma factor (sigma-70 family)